MSKPLLHITLDNLIDYYKKLSHTMRGSKTHKYTNNERKLARQIVNDLRRLKRSELHYNPKNIIIDIQPVEEAI